MTGISVSCINKMNEKIGEIPPSDVVPLMKTPQGQPRVLTHDPLQAFLTFTVLYFEWCTDWGSSKIVMEFQLQTNSKPNV